MVTPPISRLMPAPEAVLGRSDPTRRWAIAFEDGSPWFPGLTRPEAEAAAPWLAAMAPAERRAALVAVVLPVVLSDGAGPYVIDARGGLVLVLGPHRALAGALVAMGPAEPDHAIGLVERSEHGWRWIVRAQVAPADRLAALDALDEAGDRPAAAAWAERLGVA
jgi:hypothetical protein